MAGAWRYPGDMDELTFVESYLHSTLRKPQVVADAALRTLVLAGQSDRVMLTALVAEQLAEAARRLVAVVEALSDRTYPIARTLMQPLPGAQAWSEFVQLASSAPPGAMLSRLNISSTAMESAERLRGQPDLAGLTPLVAAAAGGNAMVLVRGAGGRQAPGEFMVAASSAGGETITTVYGGLEGDAATLADLTADLSSIARGFLGAYLEARRGAGRRD